jgi:hypothetical protein
MTSITFDERLASTIAQALYDRIRQMDRADFDERERYGYGPVITCDSEEIRSGIEGIRSDCYDALQQMVQQGVGTATRMLTYLHEEGERHRHVEEEAEKKCPPRGTKLRLVPPYEFVNHRNNHLIRKRHGTFLGFVVPPDCKVVYKVKIKKGLTVNRRPDEVEVA